MNHFTDGQFTAHIGIDGADTKHDVCLQAAGSGQREFTWLPGAVPDQPVYPGQVSRSLYTEPGQGRSHRNTPLFCDFITRWPTLKQVKRASRSTLEQFLPPAQQKCRSTLESHQ